MALFYKSKKEKSNSYSEVIEVGGKKIVFNSRNLVPVILQKIQNGQVLVLNLVYMNHEALLMTLDTGEVYVYRRSKNIIEKIVAQNGESAKTDSIMLSKNQRSLLLTIDEDEGGMATQQFVHTIYPVLNEDDDIGDLDEEAY